MEGNVAAEAHNTRLVYAAAGDRKKSVAEEPVTSVLTDGDVPVLEGDPSADDEVIAALGYKSVCPDPRTLTNA